MACSGNGYVKITPLVYVRSFLLSSYPTIDHQGTFIFHERNHEIVEQATARRIRVNYSLIKLCEIYFHSNIWALLLNQDFSCIIKQTMNQPGIVRWTCTRYLGQTHSCKYGI